MKVWQVALNYMLMSYFEALNIKCVSSLWQLLKYCPDQDTEGFQKQVTAIMINN